MRHRLTISMVDGKDCNAIQIRHQRKNVIYLEQHEKLVYNDINFLYKLVYKLLNIDIMI